MILFFNVEIKKIIVIYITPTYAVYKQPNFEDVFASLLLPSFAFPITRQSDVCLLPVVFECEKLLICELVRMDH